MTERNRTDESAKLYSIKAFGFATFFGGPITASYLMRHNYLAIDEPDKAKNALMVGIVSTILLFTGIYLIPENIIEKIPNIAIPTIYTIIILSLVKKLQGKLIESHEENEFPFYSSWRASGIGLLFSVIIVVCLLGTFYLTTPEEYRKYDNEMELFYSNELKALDLSEKLDGKEYSQVITEINTIILPLWDENIKVLNKVSAIPNLPSDLLTENKLLLEYSNLRIKILDLIKKSIMFDTNEYDKQIDDIYSEIDDIIEKVMSS